MTPLTQQLEDKKKGCGCSLRIVDLGQGKEIFICNSKELCKTCKSNIAILEQAIAEIKKQRQDFERILNRIIGKIEDSRNNGEMIIDYCKKIKQQLNQPKEGKE